MRYTWQWHKKKLKRKGKKRSLELPSSFYGNGDRLVIYWCSRISAKDLGVTCSRRFSVFFTCPYLSFSLLKPCRYPSSVSFCFLLLFYPFKIRYWWHVLFYVPSIATHCNQGDYIDMPRTVMLFLRAGLAHASPCISAVLQNATCTSVVNFIHIWPENVVPHFTATFIFFAPPGHSLHNFHVANFSVHSFLF